MTISAVKKEINYIGSLPLVADKIGINPETIRRWKREGQTIVYYNKAVVYLKPELL